MASTTRNELAAGIFVLSTLAAIVAVVLWLGGVQFGARYVYVTAPLAVGDVSITEGSEVKLASVVVGKVDRVIPSADWQTFTFRLSLDEDVDIRHDATIQAVAPTLGGVGTLMVLHTGSADQPAADETHPVALAVGPNAMVRDLQRELGYGSAERETLQKAVAYVGRSLGDLAAITTALRSQLATDNGPTLLTNAVETVAAFRQMANSLQSQITDLKLQLDPANPVGAMGKVHVTLDHASTASREAAEMMTAVRPDVQRAAGHTASAAERIDRYARDDVAQLLAGLRTAGTELVAIMADFREAGAATRDVITVNQDNINEMIGNLRQVSMNLKMASRDVRRHPWKLMGDPSVSDVRSENIQNAAEAFSEGAAELDDAIRRLHALRQSHPEGVGADDPQLKLIQQKVADSFEHFTRVERALWEEVSR